MVATAHTHDAWYADRLAEAKSAGRFRRIEPRDALIAARQQSGLSIPGFAHALGLYPQAVASWEAGRKPTPWWVVKRLQAFCVAEAA